MKQLKEPLPVHDAKVVDGRNQTDMELPPEDFESFVKTLRQERRASKI